jgi:hypothetical protein
MVRLSVGTTLRHALELCRAEWRALYALALLVEIPVVIADSTSIHLLDIETGATFSLETLLTGLLLLVWTTLAHHLLLAAVEEVEASRRRGEPRISIISVVRGLPVGRLLAADVLITAAYVVGFVLLIVPGLVVLVWTTPVFPLLSMERQGIRATVRRSIEIVRGNAWRVLLIVAAVWITSQILGGIVSTLLHDQPWLSAVTHHLAVLAFEPLAAAVVVVATYELVGIDAARRRDPVSTE